MDRRTVRRFAGLVGGLLSAGFEFVTHAYVIADEKSLSFGQFHFFNWSDVVLQALIVFVVVDVAIHLFLFDFFYAEAFEAIRDHFPSENSAEAVKDLREGLARLKNNLPIGIFRVERPEDYFQQRLTTLTLELQSSLEQLRDGHYEEFLNNEISDISIDIYKTLKQGAFCTALEEHLNIFTDFPRSKDLVAANDEAAQRLHEKQTHRKKIVRLFILDNWSSVPKHLSLMRQQHERFVEVKVILRETVHSAGIYEQDIDFGIWDDALVMKITGSKGSPKLVVSKKETELRRALEIKSALESKCMDWRRFIELLRDPMNSNWGQFADSDLKLFLPPPNGPGPRDVEVMFAEGRKSIPPTGGRIGILGLTGPLIAASENYKKTTDPSLQIEVVDIRCDPGASNGIHYTKENWLDWHAKTQFDTIFGDDILCNLKLWQFPLLFEGLNKALKVNGCFVVRTTIHPKTIAHIDKRMMLELLRSRGKGLEEIWAIPDASTDRWRSERETAAYELAWPFLHHENFYDRKDIVENGFDLGEWNRWISGEVRSGDLDASLGQHLSLKYSVKITSPSPVYLTNQAVSHGFMAYDRDVQSIWASDERYRALDRTGEIASRFKEHYKIFVFKKQRNHPLPEE